MKRIKLNKPIVIGLIIISIAMLVLSALTLAVEGSENTITFTISVVVYGLATSAIIYFVSYLINIELEHELHNYVKAYKRIKYKYASLSNENDSLSRNNKYLNQLKNDYIDKLCLIVNNHKALVKMYNTLVDEINSKNAKIKELSETIKGYETAYGRIKNSES